MNERTHHARIPPMWVKIQTSGGSSRRSHSVGLPLFLVWVLVLPLVLVALALFAIVGAAAIVFARRRVIQFARALRGSYEVLCASRGTRIEASGGGGRDAIIVIQ